MIIYQLLNPFGANRTTLIRIHHPYNENTEGERLLYRDGVKAKLLLS